MAAPDPVPTRRRFVTRCDVEDAHRAGQPVVLGPTDVITHEAAQRARDLDVTVERADRPAAPRWTGVAPRPLVAEPVVTDGGAPLRHAEAADLRSAVRSAVVEELGHEPAGLDAAIDRVLQRRQA
jgi:hypothetical protein